MPAPGTIGKIPGIINRVAGQRSQTAKSLDRKITAAAEKNVDSAGESVFVVDTVNPPLIGMKRRAVSSNKIREWQIGRAHV